ncbi:hypothetical protein NIIDMKKI_03020 [Mycobacterium kansasii]|uniref:Uncharacterized protein n=1 Tax=Mycobacterium kansasii TaxID=1768 RepID=A0A7G1I220_MYCKA|nr:hypothetical protein NIIDMKKI_03020 [Mycobacterium kansasii]
MQCGIAVDVPVALLGVGPVLRPVVLDAHPQLLITLIDAARSYIARMARSGMAAAADAAAPKNGQSGSLMGD